MKILHPKGWGVEVTSRQIIIFNNLRTGERSNTDQDFSQGSEHPNVYVTMSTLRY